MPGMSNTVIRISFGNVEQNWSGSLSGRNGVDSSLSITVILVNTGSCELIHKRRVNSITLHAMMQQFATFTCLKGCTLSLNLPGWGVELDMTKLGRKWEKYFTKKPDFWPVLSKIVMVDFQMIQTWARCRNTLNLCLKQKYNIVFYFRDVNG